MERLDNMDRPGRIVGICPPDDRTVKRWVNRLQHAYGGCFDVINAGKSLTGRSIIGLRMGRAASPVLYCGGVHGREWITTLLLMYFAEDVLNACFRRRRLCGMDIAKMLCGRSLLIVPALNPDGVEISINGAYDSLSSFLSADLREACRSREYCRLWKANARGVDINRNFDAAWDEMRSIAMSSGICGPCSGGWTGEYPESEPETQAMVSLCERMNFHHVIAFHSQGEEIYWNYRDFTPPKAHLMAKILSVSSGYALKEPEYSASSAGLKDWFMQRYHAPAFTVEVGSGECPLPLDGFEFLYRRLCEMLVLGVAV